MFDLLEPISKEMQLVEKALLENLQSDNEFINQINTQIVGIGGKRLRPALFLLISNLLQYTDDIRFTVAAAVELVHTASLLHDDVVDNSNTRRTKPTVNSVWNNKTAILSGDRTFSIACNMILSAKNFMVIERFTNCIRTMSESELIQGESLWNENLTEKQYLDLLYGKTAVLFEMAAQLPSILFESSKTVQSSLASFGKNLGIAFQIVDDCLDIKGGDANFGKPAFADLLEGKLTLPVIIGLQDNSKASHDLRKIISKICHEKKASPTQAQQVKEILLNCGAWDRALERARVYTIDAQRDLTSVITKFSPQLITEKIYETIVKLTNFIVDRKF